MNPYQWFPIYTPDAVSRYKNRARTDVPPHVYAAADQAYRYLLKDKKSQSMLVTYVHSSSEKYSQPNLLKFLFFWLISIFGFFIDLLLVENQVLEKPKIPNVSSNIWP